MANTGDLQLLNFLSQIFMMWPPTGKQQKSNIFNKFRLNMICLLLYIFLAYASYKFMASLPDKSTANILYGYILVSIDHYYQIYTLLLAYVCQIYYLVIRQDLKKLLTEFELTFVSCDCEGGHFKKVAIKLGAFFLIYLVYDCNLQLKKWPNIDFFELIAFEFPYLFNLIHVFLVVTVLSVYESYFSKINSVLIRTNNQLFRSNKVHFNKIFSLGKCHFEKINSLALITKIFCPMFLFFCVFLFLSSIFAMFLLSKFILLLSTAKMQMKIYLFGDFVWFIMIIGIFVSYIKFWTTLANEVSIVIFLFYNVRNCASNESQNSHPVTVNIQ